MKKNSVSSSIVRAASLIAIRNAEKHFDTSQHIDETEIPTELFSIIRWTLCGFKDLHGKRITWRLTTLREIYVTPYYTM